MFFFKKNEIQGLLNASSGALLKKTNFLNTLSPMGLGVMRQHLKSFLSLLLVPMSKSLPKNAKIISLNNPTVPLEIRKGNTVGSFELRVSYSLTPK